LRISAATSAVSREPAGTSGTTGLSCIYAVHWLVVTWESSRQSTFSLMDYCFAASLVEKSLATSSESLLGKVFQELRYFHF
jgi:hypothetical protein